jgi:hypothetical protein
MTLQEKSDHRCAFSTGWSAKGLPHSTTNRYNYITEEEEEEKEEEEE